MYNEYLSSTFDNPNQYYWAQINKSLSAMTKREETKTKWTNHFKESLNKEAYKLGVPVNDKKMNAQLCFKACQAVLMEMVYTFGKAPHVAYALEFFNYAPTRFDLGENLRTVNSDTSSFYNKMLDRLEATLLTESNSAILCNSTNGYSNNVVDLDLLRNELKRVVENFYEENPELKQSTNHVPELQEFVKKILSNLSLSFDKKAKSLYGNFGKRI